METGKYSDATNTTTPPPEEPVFKDKPESHHHKTQKAKHGGGFWSLALLLAGAAIIGLGLNKFVFQSYAVDGPSMQSTLQHGDRLLVYKGSRTIARLTGNTYIPNRGDVIIFNEKSVTVDGVAYPEKQLIKRVIGIPGDRVVIENNTVTVYNGEYPEGFDPDKHYPYGKNIGATIGQMDVSVKAGEVFVLGDNRFNSTDSRVLGPIKADDIVAKLIMRIMPLDKAKIF